LGSKKSFHTHEIIFRKTEFDVFPTQTMAQIKREFEWELKRIDLIYDQITKIISVKSSLIEH
jgi:hypothetical protein